MGELFERYERQVFATALRRLRRLRRGTGTVPGGLRAGDDEAVSTAQSALFRCLAPLDRSPYGHQSDRAAHRSPRRSPQSLKRLARRPRTPLANVLVRERDDQLRAGLGRLGYAGSRDLAGLLYPRPVTDRNERPVRRAGRHDQAASARGSQTAMQRGGRIGAGLSECRLPCLARSQRRRRGVAGPILCVRTRTRRRRSARVVRAPSPLAPG